MKVVYMGTPDFAVPALEAIINAGHEVLAVVSQPDKAKGRSKELVPTPVKEVALKYNLKVMQPDKIKEESAVQELQSLNPDMIVVAAYGQILPESILNIPKYGCVNLHASLLPKYRGAAPIQWAVIDGEEYSGVTAMYMEKGLDTGDIIDVVKYKLDDKETGGSLFDKLSELGGDLILKVMKDAEDGNVSRTPQNHDESTYAKMLSKDMGNIDWSKSSAEIERLIRGLNPWPSAYSFLNGKTLKIWDADIVDMDGVSANGINGKEVDVKEWDGTEPGQVTYVDKKTFLVKTSDGCLKINELQLEGKKRMETDAFLRGYRLEAGVKLTREK